MKKRILLALAPLVLVGSVWGGVAYAHARQDNTCFVYTVSPTEPHMPTINDTQIGPYAYRRCVKSVPD